MSSTLVSSSSRRFAVLKTGRALPYTELTYGGYAHMLRNLLRSQNSLEQWDVFDVLDGDFSFLNRVDDYDGFVLTGSSADAHANEDWIVRLCDALRLLHRKRKRLLGICFGHQVLARALGGKTGRADVGWELGLKRLSVQSDAVRNLFGVDLGRHIHVMESHRDQVSEVPPGAVVLASSEKTKIEMYALEDNVLAMQFHPEFTKDVVIDLIQKRISTRIITDEFAKEAMKSLEGNEADREPLKRLCTAFLKGSSVVAPEK